MIKCEKGNVTIHGSGACILAELSSLVHALYYTTFVDEAGKPMEEGKKLILEAVEKGFKTNEELMAGMDSADLVKVLEMVADLLKGKGVE